MKELLLLIPAYNEEENLPQLLDKLRQEGYTRNADVLVVNDASNDKTAWIARQHGANVISHAFNLGYGCALQSGYKYAVRKGYRYIIQLDADGQHDLCNIETIFRALKTPNADGQCPQIVLGSRFLPGSVSFPVSGLKMVSIRFFRAIIRALTGQAITDPTSGLQGLCFETFLYYSMYNNFDNMYPDANMLIQMLLKGYKIQEVPSVMHEREHGVSMHSGILKPLIYMMVMPISIFSVYRRDKLHLQRSIQVYQKEES